MRLKATLGSLAALALTATLAAANTPDASQTGPRLPDGVPPGYSIPPDAGNQAFEFGRCDSREHSPGGWVCTEPVVAGSGARRRRGTRLEGNTPPPRRAQSAQHR